MPVKIRYRRYLLIYSILKNGEKHFYDFLPIGFVRGLI